MAGSDSAAVAILVVESLEARECETELDWVVRFVSVRKCLILR